MKRKIVKWVAFISIIALLAACKDGSEDDLVRPGNIPDNPVIKVIPETNLTPAKMRAISNNVERERTYVILDFSDCSFTGDTITKEACSDRIYYNKYIKGIILPANLTSIGDNAFSGCTNLTSVIIPADITIIGANAFFQCIGLTSITIPNSVETIGDYAFQRCSSLTGITIPNNVQTIGEHAFEYCPGLTGIEVNHENSKYSSNAGVLFNKELTELILFPGGKGVEYTIPNSVRIIRNYAFADCTRLAKVIIPTESVLTIGADTFSGCTSLTSIIISNGVTSIGENAFKFCDSLASVTIPVSVVSIEASAFQDCKDLINIIIPSGVTSIGPEAFSGCKSLISVTFEENSDIDEADFGDNVFPEGAIGDGGNTLKQEYLAGPKPGTYTRESDVKTWIRQVVVEEEGTTVLQ